MPDLPHLILPRAEYDLPRKKTGYGRPPKREHGDHGTTLATQVDQVMTKFQERTRPQQIDPSLVLKIRLNPDANIDEETWERCGLSLLSVDKGKTLVLFASDSQLADFKRRLTEYTGGPQGDRKSAPHTQIFASIDEIGEVLPADRIGRVFRTEGISTPDDIEDSQELAVDVELWDLGTTTANTNKVNEIRAYIETQNGRVTDQYVGDSLILIRCKVSGLLLKELLELEAVAIADLPPKPSLTVSNMLATGIEDLNDVEAPADGSPGVAILDSGITSAHPLLEPAIGEATSVPQQWGDASDGHGHGTMVGGIALYGNIEQCIENRSFIPNLTLYSARVLNDNNEFDDEELITTQMRESIEYFKNTYDCRVFNASLGDSRQPYVGGKVSPWASILDTLARDLDVVIVVSAGNYDHDPAGTADSHIQDYPRYLLSDAAKIIEPATGAIVVTVGAIAGSDSVPPGASGNNVAFRPIALKYQPSPFTRSGFGLGGAIKPELCDVGGNNVYDGQIQDIRSINENSVVSTNRVYLRSLFTTDNGTSFSAPRVAHAAARLYSQFPDASANLIRALLASSAVVPQESLDLLDPIDKNAVLQVCGYGRPALERAQLSDESRVVLYAQESLGFDNFHIYEVPIPDELLEENGTRTISVSLAFDPPVRHTRFDYLGVKMSFRLIRGKSAADVAEAYRARTKKEAKVDPLGSTKFNCSLIPTPTIREGGTLQKASFTFKRTPDPQYGNTYYLVVRCERKWARDEHSPQRYAVVVTVEHSADINLYNTIQQRVTARVRVRPRARG